MDDMAAAEEQEENSGEDLVPLQEALEEVEESEDSIEARLTTMKASIMPMMFDLVEKHGADSDTARDAANLVSTGFHELGTEACDTEAPDYTLATEALRIAYRLEPYPDNKKEIEDDLAPLEERMRTVCCHFCQQNQAREKSLLDVPMYLVTGRGYSTINYQKLRIKVPRCLSCAQQQGIASLTSWSFWGMTTVGGLALASYPGAFIGAVAGWGISSATEYLMHRQSRQKWLGEYPPVKELRDQGWKYGEEPGKYG